MKYIVRIDCYYNGITNYQEFHTLEEINSYVIDLRKYYPTMKYKIYTRID